MVIVGGLLMVHPVLVAFMWICRISLVVLAALAISLTPFFGGGHGGRSAAQHVRGSDIG